MRLPTLKPKARRGPKLTSLCTAAACLLVAPALLAAEASSDFNSLRKTMRSHCLACHDGEQAEAGFCEAKGLNQQTLKVTADAKRQLHDLMVNQGF